jgi:hypothetical protein
MVRQQKIPEKIARSGSRDRNQTSELLLPLYNYACLTWVTAFVVIGFLPNPVQKYFEKILWNFPVIVMGIVVTGLFFVFNRKTVASVLSAPLFSFTQPLEAKDAKGAFSERGGSGFCLLVAAALMISGFMLFSYNLDNADFQEDEFLVLNAAEGYRQTGTYAKWDFIRNELSKDSYARAWPHTWLVAQAFRIFGISEWSGRIVSVICGCFFAVLSFFVVRYIFADTLFACLISLVFLLNPDYIYYWRLTRMYAPLLPAFLLLAFAVFKAMEGRQSSPGSDPAGGFSIRQYAGFDYLFIAISLALLYLNYNIHVNSLLIGLSGCLYISLLALFGGEKKYIALGLLILFVISLDCALLPASFFHGLFKNKKFFQAVHPLYIRLMAARPFFPIVNVSFLISSALVIPMAADDVFRKKLLFLYTIVFTALVFFVFVVEYYGRHYRYISHVTPFAILMICFSYVTMLKVFQSKPILIAGLVMLLAAQSGNFIRMADTLYHGVSGQPRFSAAYEVVKKNIRDGEAIFAQYLRNYYMRGIPVDTPLISLGNLERDTPGTNPYTFDKFFNDLRVHKTGWVIWEKPKEYHIDPKIAAYVKTLFKKTAGEGLDVNHVEIYRFHESMIKTPNFK